MSDPFENLRTYFHWMRLIYYKTILIILPRKQGKQWIALWYDITIEVLSQIPYIYQNHHFLSISKQVTWTGISP